MGRLEIGADVFDKIKRVQKELYRREIATEAKIEDGTLYLYYDENDLPSIITILEKYKIGIHKA
jgi:hypothetical protein